MLSTQLASTTSQLESMAVIAAPALSEYEQQRLAHIRRNHEFLVGLGLADASVDPVAALNGKPSKPRAPSASPC